MTLQQRCLFRFLWVPMICLTVSEADAAGLIRVSDGKTSFEGKVVGLSETTCSLIDREGKLLQLDVASLTKFEKISTRFHPLAMSAMRDRLRKEFPGGYDVAGTTHYLVCAPSGRAAEYAQLFENIYRDVEHFFRVRGFRIHKPDVPLIAIVFRTQQEFAQYCVRDQVAPSPGLLGYYSLKTNRVALFDDSTLLSSRGESDKPAAGRQSIAALTAISGNTAATIIHETTHQVGYNIGVHSRLGGTPVWVVEGLATVLEPDGMRNSRGRRLLESRLNEERINWFTQQHRPTRQSGNLAKIVASDEFFHRKTLNSYSESWAFTFFLLEKPSRQRDLVSYLQKLSQRDHMKPYTARERLADFQDVFGDIARLETEFIRYMDRM